MRNNERFMLCCDMRMSADEEAEVMIYGRIVQSRWDDESEITAKDFDKMLKEARKGGAKRLRLRINSGGGSVFQAVAMRTMLMNAGFDEIRVCIDGLCASAATLLCCIPGVPVSMGEGAMYMIHNPSSCILGDARAMEQEAERLRKIEDEVRRIYADRSGKSEDEIKECMNNETWFTAQEAIEAGFADEVIDGADAAACVSTQEMEVMQRMYMHIPSVIQPTAPCVSNADKASENIQANEEEKSMELKDMTPEQLMQACPELYNTVTARGAESERQRMEEIDALTPPGYAAAAAEAKRTGESAMDYYKRIVQMQHEKGEAYLQQRGQEVAQSRQVTGGDAKDHDGDDEADMEACAKEIAGYARAYCSGGTDGMY